MLFAYVKHTFIEVTEASEHQKHARCQSCPPSIWKGRPETNRQAVEQDTTSTYLWQEQASIIGWTHSGSSASPHNSDQSQSDENPRNSNAAQCKKRSSRPCKGKRLRFRKFVERLKTQVDSKVEFFDIEEVAWPPSLETNDKKRQLLIKRMEQYQRNALCHNYNHVTNSALRCAK